MELFENLFLESTKGIFDVIRKYQAETPADKRSWEDFCAKGYNVNGDVTYTKGNYTAVTNYFNGAYKRKPNGSKTRTTAPKQPTTVKASAPVEEAPQEEDNSNYTYIDGFRVDESKAFKDLNASYLTKRYNEFNERYFDGKLPNIPVIVGHRKTALGTCWSYSRKSSYRPVRTIKIEISDFVIRNERSVCATLIHEMIHCYEADVLDSVTGHGYNFKSKMNEINRKSREDGKSTGWNVTTKSSDLDGVNTEVNTKYANKVVGDYLLIIDYNIRRNQYLKCLIPSSKLGAFKARLKYYADMGNKYVKLYKIKNGAPYYDLKKCLSKLSGQLTDLEQVENDVKQGYIVPVPFNEAKESKINKFLQRVINLFEKDPDQKVIKIFKDNTFLVETI